MLTYGDAVADVDIKSLVEHHKLNQKLVTACAIHPKTHYGELDLIGDQVVPLLKTRIESKLDKWRIFCFRARYFRNN